MLLILKLSLLFCFIYIHVCQVCVCIYLCLFFSTHMNLHSNYPGLFQLEGMDLNCYCKIGDVLFWLSRSYRGKTRKSNNASFRLSLHCLCRFFTGFELPPLVCRGRNALRVIAKGCSGLPFSLERAFQAAVSCIPFHICRQSGARSDCPLW